MENNIKNALIKSIDEMKMKRSKYQDQIMKLQSKIEEINYVIDMLNTHLDDLKK